MANDLIQKQLGEKITLNYIQTSRFKTSRISLSFAMPLTAQTAAANAAIPFLLHRSSKKYSNFTLINRRLAMLYGAALSADTVKAGEAQVMKIAISALNDNYALKRESIGAQCAEMLCDLLFDPLAENGAFDSKQTEQEKRLLIETLEAEMSEKRVYALKRCEEIMCGNEAYGIDRYGSIPDIKQLNGSQIYKAWEDMLKTAAVQINVIGNADIEKITEHFTGGFSKIGRGAPVSCSTNVVKEVAGVKEVTEKQQINQGKLVMGLRAGTSESDSDMIAARVMTDLYGGGPYSRLFVNVREKMSLCYYCAARYNRYKGIITVQSGIETENKTKAVDEIQNQLGVMQNGGFEESELEASKNGLRGIIKTAEDTPESLDEWYGSQMFVKNMLSPGEYSEEIAKVNRDDIVRTAKRVKLDTIYMLEPAGNAEAGAEA